MRGKRSKQYRKLMQQYHLHFGFREPYQVLVDAAILQDAARFRMDFAGGLEKALHGKVKLMMTQCCIRHLYTTLPSSHPLIAHAKGFERRRCNHHTLTSPLSTLECLREVVDPKGSSTNKNRYVVASQDADVRGLMRTIPGVPLVYLKRSVMILEPMAGSSEIVRDREERGKFRAGLKGARGGPSPGAGATRIRDKEAGESFQGPHKDSIVDGSAAGPKNSEAGLEPAKKKRKRGPKEPNPLSVKKSKRNIDSTASAEEVPSARTAANITAPLLQDGAVHEAATKRKRIRRHKSANDPRDETLALRAGSGSDT